MARGEFAAGKLAKDRKKWRKKEAKYKKKREKQGKKGDLMGGAPQAKGIVLEKRGVTARQPNSGIRKCVRVQLIKNGKQVAVTLTYKIVLHHYD